MTRQKKQDKMSTTISAEIYKENLSVLRNRFPHIHTALTGDAARPPVRTEPFLNALGQVNARITLSDHVMPFYPDDDIVGTTAESMKTWRLSAGDFLFCIGMGLGYLPKMAADLFLRQKAGARPRIVIFEPFPVMLRLALQCMDLRRLLQYEGLEIHLGETVDIVGVINRLSFDLFLGKQRVVIDGNSKRIFGDAFEKMEKAVVSCIGVVRDLWHTAKELGPDIFANTLQNLPSLFSGVTLGRLTGLLDGIPAICVAAGPSLDRAIPHLKRVRNRAVILAVDSAVPSLVAAGIRPHMVVTADVRNVNFRKYRAVVDQLEESVLVFAVESNPDNVKKFPTARKLAVSINNPLLERWLCRRWNLACGLPSMTTVTHAAVFTALALGADPVVLVGMDMAFPDGRSHASGAIHQWDLDNDGLISVDGVNGLPVLTYRPLNDYRIQMEQIIAGRRDRFINTSPDGAWINGTQVKSLEEVLDTELRPDMDVTGRLDAVRWSSDIDIVEILDALDEMIGMVDRFLVDCREERMRSRLCLDPADNGNGGDADTDRLVVKAEAMKADHAVLIEMLWGIRLADISVIESKKRGVYAENDARRPSAVPDRIAILRDEFASHEDAATLFLTHLTALRSYYETRRSLSGETGGAEEGYEAAMALARHEAEAGEAARAAAIYARCRSRFPDRPEGWTEAVALYQRCEMRRPALWLIRGALQRFPENTQIRRQWFELRREMHALFEEAISAWMKQDLEKAHLNILEYLAVFPEDHCASALKKELARVREKRGRAVVDRVHSRDKALQEVALLESAQQWIRENMPERAVGILRWLAENVSGGGHQYLKIIGDLRFSQNDYAAAQWHYERALASNPQDERLKAKLKQTRRLAETVVNRHNGCDDGRHQERRQPESVFGSAG